MLSTKTLATLLLFTLNMQLAASSGTLKIRASGTSTLLIKKSKSKPTSKFVLQDETNTTEAVQAVEMSTEEVVQAQEPSVPQINKEFKELFNLGKYVEIFALGEKMKPNEFMKRLCSVVETAEQYKGFVEFLKKYIMVTLFYIYGDIGVVRRAILANSSIYDEYSYVDGGDLEAALPLALNNDCHDRVIELLNVRHAMTAEEDEQRKHGKITSFEGFVNHFLLDLAPEKDDMALRRFLTHREDELRTKHSDIFGALCEGLVWHLRHQLDKPKAENLLIDLVGQPSLLTPVSFTKEFLFGADDRHHSAFIKYGWAEALQEGLKGEYLWGGEALWRVMREEGWVQSHEKFPETEEECAVACKRFPTKKQKEDEWGQFALKNSTILSTKLNTLPFIFSLISRDLWSIVAEYAISLADIDSTASRSELISSNSV